MKLKKTLPLFALALLGSLSLVSQAGAAPLQEDYGFSTSAFGPFYENTYALPTGLTDADIDTSFGVSVTGFSNPYSISPVSSSFIQRIYLGTSPDDLATEVTAADLGTTFSNSGPPFTDTQPFSATGISLGNLGAYSYITIYTDFTLSADTIADGDGSIFVYQVPEPSTWALLLGGLGVLGFVAIRRRSLI
jgi:hypothetical protein